MLSTICTLLPKDILAYSSRIKQALFGRHFSHKKVEENIFVTLSNNLLNKTQKKAQTIKGKNDEFD